jgi:hypothetical protein|tara:strand:- start:12667 stop:13779 length:1113 start_codon:yes stop_codon:yes gene_type:complete
MAVNDIADNGLGGAYIGTYASKILLEPMFHSDDIKRNYTIYPTVKYKQNIMMAPSLKGITALNTGCTATNTCTGNTFQVTQKTIETMNVSVKQQQCWDEFKSEVIVESYKNGINMPDLSGTQLADVIINRVRNGIMNDMSRNIWAGFATGGAAVADCSYESMGEGLWNKLGADANFANAGSLQRVTGGGVAADYNVVGARIPAADAAIVLGQAFEGAPAELQQVDASKKRMFVTPNIYNAWYASLTAVATNGAVDYGHSEAQTGKGRLFFRGIELVPMYVWDEALTARTGADRPDIFDVTDSAAAGFSSMNGVIYAAVDSLFIGTDVNAPENELKMFYDEVSDNMYVRSYFTMGFQYGWTNLVYGATLTS